MVTYFLNDEMPMNEPIDENQPAFVSASGTSQICPTWEAKEVADAINRISRKGHSSGTIKTPIAAPLALLSPKAGSHLITGKTLGS